MSDLISAVDQEIAELEDALRADPRHQKLKALRELRALYGGASAGFDVSSAAAPKPPASRRDGLQRRIDPDRLKILEEVEVLLDVLGPDPVKTADLYDVLVASGHRIGGNEPKSNLSAMLFNSGRFVSNGRRGWTLKPKPEEPEQLEEESV